MKKIAIVIPTYNELENIESLIKAILKNTSDVTIFLVDDSKDESIGSLINSKNLKVKYFHRKNERGRGSAVLYGFKKALEEDKYDIFIEMDADFSHDPKELTPMLKKLETNTDLVVGSRYVNGVNVVNWPMSRILLSYFASIYIQILTSMPIKDATAGFVGYRRRVLESISLDQVKFVGYAFQIEMKYRAWIKKFNVEEHPIIFTNRVLGKSKMNSNIIWEALYGVLFLRINKRRLK